MGYMLHLRPLMCKSYFDRMLGLEPWSSCRWIAILVLQPDVILQFTRHGSHCIVFMAYPSSSSCSLFMCFLPFKCISNATSLLKQIWHTWISSKSFNAVSACWLSLNLHELDFGWLRLHLEIWRARIVSGKEEGKLVILRFQQSVRFVFNRLQSV